MAIQTILVVEDNDINLELTADLLESAGYEVLQARSAEEGIRITQADLPDLILMDVCLPRMDGLTATKVLQEDPRTSPVPVVALTANAMSGAELNAISAGCVGYICKQINTRSFKDMIARFLSL